MTHYRASRRDIEFTLFDVLGAHENWATDGPAEMSRETASEILRGAEQWAVEQFASSYEAGDDQPPTYDPATGEVRLAKSVRETIQQQLASEWIALDLPAELSDTPVPPSLRWAAAEFAMGANPAVSMCTNVTPVTATVLAKWGTADQRNLAKLMLERGWTSTMAITEDDAGSDVGAIRTKAVEREDGSWSITGTKRFITFGDHDAADNIIHLVLARPQLTDEAPKSGTRGLALFVVPKFRYEADGTIGDHNGIRVTGLAHKMGLKASPTCELSFGDTTETIGWALGGSTGGMQQIFDVIRNVRMLVGVKSVAALSSGYLVAHEYAVTRVQGNRLGRAGGPKVAIIEHPDVRRSLLTQKATVEGLRALALYTALIGDLLEAAEDDADADRLRTRHALLLPIVKGYCSEMACRVLSAETLQVLGGSGYLRDYPIEQYIRDTKIDTIYEGTTGIQGIDLFARRFVPDGGAVLTDQFAEIIATCERHQRTSTLGQETAMLAQTAREVIELAMSMARQWNNGDTEAAGYNTTRLLFAVGHVLTAWLLLRQADAALELLENAGDDSFYLSKVATARWFLLQTLPSVSAEVKAADLIGSSHEEWAAL